MTYTARDRDRHRLAVSAATGAVALGSLTSVGWLTGAAAYDLAQDEAVRKEEQRRQQAEYAAALARSQQPAPPELVQRPTRVRVTTRYVTGASQSAGTRASSGGTVSRPTTAGSSSSGPGPSGGGGPGPSAPPPPPPPPAPSSGS